MRAGRLLRAGLVLAALGMAPASTAHAESVIRVALNADIRSTDPGVNRDGNTDMVMLHMMEGLVAYREDTSVGPLLAEKVEISPDGLAYTFTLRRGVRFHNGATLTSADVKFVWERYLRPETNWRCLPDFDGRGPTKIVGIDTPDAFTVVFHIDKPSALFLSTMARDDCGGAAIYHRDSLNPDGTWNTPIGTGPFRLGTWRKGQYVELERFTDYAARPGPRDGNTGGKAAEVDKVRFVVIPDPDAAKAALLSGSIDLRAGVPARDIAELEARPDIAVETVETMPVFAILLQTKDPILKDARIRRALALALDCPEMVSVVTEGHGSYNPSLIPTRSAFHTAAETLGYHRDLDEARRLLKEAGYAGQPLKMLTNKRYPEVYEITVLAQAMAAEAGINIEFEVIDWATQLDRYVKGDYTLMGFVYSARLDPSLSFDMIMGPKALQPRKLWDDAAAQALLAESMTTSDPQRRQALFDELQRRLIEATPIITLYNEVLTTAYRKTLQGYRSWASGHVRLWGVRLVN